MHEETFSLRYLNTKQAAAYLGMSPQWLEGYRCKGGGPRFARLARNAVRYDTRDLDAWVAQRKAASTAEYEVPS